MCRPHDRLLSRAEEQLSADRYDSLVAIWFLRHGESEANADGFFAGQSIDSPLTAQGQEQARKAALQLTSRLDWIVSSPLARALETAEIVLTELDSPLRVELDPRLVEYDVGKAAGMPTRAISAEQMEAEFEAEPATAFARRVMSAVAELSQRSGTGLVVSHAGVARMISTNLAGLPVWTFRQQPILKNAEPVLIDDLALPSGT